MILIAILIKSVLFPQETRESQVSIWCPELPQLFPHLGSHFCIPLALTNCPAEEAPLHLPQTKSEYISMGDT